MSYYNPQDESDPLDHARDHRFPPHPSVRIPPHGRVGPSDPRSHQGRNMPQYSHPRNAPRPMTRPPKGDPISQGYHFPRAPPSHHQGRRPRHAERVGRMPPAPPAPRHRRPDQHIPPQEQRYNMHKSYVSSVADEASPMPTPQPPSGPFVQEERYSASLYTAEETTQVPGEPIADPQDTNIIETAEEPSAQSPGKPKHIRPPPLTIATSNRTEPNLSPVPPTPRTREAQMNALKAAIEASLREQPREIKNVGPDSDVPTHIRMPFDTSPPISPVSPDLPRPRIKQFLPADEQLAEPTADDAPSTTSSARSNSALLGPVVDTSMSPTHAIRSPKSPRFPRSPRSPQFPHSPNSPGSNNALGGPADTRGSTTSLTDLIRRATKLASNLEKGKTASRLGLNDFLSSGDANGTSWGLTAHGTKNLDRASKAQFLDFEKIELNEEPEKKSKNKSDRRCCGMSLTVFIIIIVAVLVVIAAAVLIPVFLIVIPRLQTGIIDVSHCSRNSPCENGGITVIVNSQCSCVCANGFTGRQCTLTNSDANCTAMGFSEGPTDFKNATVGSVVLPVLSTAQPRFDIKLNSSRILALFSSGNATCLNENSLVDFTSIATNTVRVTVKRAFSPAQIDAHNFENILSQNIHKHNRRFLTNPNIRARQNPSTVSSTNGIIYAASSTAIPTPAPSGLTVVNHVPISTLDSRASTPGVVSPVNATSQQQVDFAKVVVLYVLEQSGVLTVAVNARQRMVAYLTSPNATADAIRNGTRVEVGYGDLKLTADFGTFSITKGDGSKIGELRA